MPLKKRFSENLRQLCKNEPSYAHVAREIGINRQQFNDYVTGKSLPNETIVTNLAKYFNVDVSRFFANTNLPRSETQMDRVQKIIGRNSFNNFRDGYYYCYFLIEGNKPVRTLMFVKNENGVTTFRRLTLVKEFTSASNHYLRSKHIGVVLSIENEIVFLGLNTTALREPSILVGNFIFSENMVLGGKAFSWTDGYSVVPFVATNTPKDLGLRDLVRRTGLIGKSQMEDEEIISVMDYFKGWQ